MRSHRLPAALLVGAGLLCAAPVLAIAPDHAREGGAVALPSLARAADPARRAALDAAPAWRTFRDRHDGWRALWNEATGTPHRAFGRGIALEGFRGDADGVDRAVRGFVSGHPELFAGRPELERIQVREVEGRWYARYRQVVNGLPVLFADWEFRVSHDGRLVAFGADAVAADAAAARAPRIPAVVAREAARAGVDFDPATDRAEVRDALWMLPVRAGDATVLRPVYEVRLSVAEPRAEWVTLVDAEDGTVRWRHDRVRHVIGGTVNGTVHPTRASEPVVVRPFKDLRVTVGGAGVFTNAAGAYSAPAAGVTNVNAQLLGRWVDVNRQDAVDAMFSTNVADPATVNIAWATAHEAERDGYYHTSLIHDYVKAIVPAFTGVDYPMPCAVNINATCNAFWDGSGINFYLAGGGCPNTATMPDVVYHEYGHGVNDNLYVGEGSPFGMINGALHEGTADVLAAMAQDDFRVGKDFFGPGTVLRSLDNTNRWPQDDGEGHFAGLTIGGAFWDLREAVGLAIAERLHLLAKFGIPDDFDNGTAMAEYFIEVLIADDNDANLSNGTPNDDAIIAAFNAHGIGTGFFVDITHAPLADQPGNGPYPVVATIDFSGPVGALDTSSPTLWFSVNGTPFQSAPMTPAGPPDQYVAQLPATAYGVVRYYITATDQLGFGRAFPLLAPSDQVTFLAGATITAFNHDQEINHGWTVGAVGDNAPTGIWLRADPVGTEVAAGIFAQPEDDHTAGGVNCFVTGNAAPGQGAGVNDVDAGRTTLLTPVFSAAGLHLPVIDYWRWYTNDLGSAPGEDFWRVDISNDGGATWSPVENTNVASNAWKRVLFFIDDVIAPTATMRMRFIAEDAGSGSLVEAAVDDLRLLSYPALVSAGGPPPAALALAAPAPNPFSGATRIAYTLPEGGDVALRIVDLQGRMVRTLARGTESAGPHVASWDGRDDGGRPVAAGTYWVRLSAAGRELTRRVVRLP